VKSFPPARIRNVALVGHGGAGKTSLAEALLFSAGAISRQGRVEDGNTTTDFDPEEIKRGISLTLALAPFERDGYKINLLDAPGYADFVLDVHAALRVADLAVFVVSGVEGPEVQTEVVWRLAAQRGVPRMFFVNKLDRERASFERTLDQLRERFGTGVAPLQLPVGEEHGFRGVVDLLADAAFLYDGAKQGTQADVPADVADEASSLRETLIEGIVMADDDLMERYLEGEALEPKELGEALAKGVTSGTVFPVACGSATKLVGVDRLGQLLCEAGPSPLDRPPVTVTAGGGTTEVAPDPAGQPLAFVFRTVADPFVG
jgi:elongation factor G